MNPKAQDHPTVAVDEPTMQAGVPPRGTDMSRFNSDNAARSAGVTVDSTPAAGAVGQSGGGRAGHVVWVAAVHSDGTVTVGEYNYNNPSAYGTRRVSKSSFVYLPSFPGG
jgi:hypothetical protein